MKEKYNCIEVEVRIPCQNNINKLQSVRRYFSPKAIKYMHPILENSETPECKLVLHSGNSFIIPQSEYHELVRYFRKINKNFEDKPAQCKNEEPVEIPKAKNPLDFIEV